MKSYIFFLLKEFLTSYTGSSFVHTIIPFQIWALLVYGPLPATDTQTHQ